MNKIHLTHYALLQIFVPEIFQITSDLKTEQYNFLPYPFKVHFFINYKLQQHGYTFKIAHSYITTLVEAIDTLLKGYNQVLRINPSNEDTH